MECEVAAMRDTIRYSTMRSIARTKAYHRFPVGSPRAVADLVTVQVMEISEDLQ